MKSMATDSIITMVSTSGSGVDQARLRDARDGAAANGISLPGSGDR
jgi:hypothetical protein